MLLFLFNSYHAQIPRIVLGVVETYPPTSVVDQGKYITMLHRLHQNYTNVKRCKSKYLNSVKNY